MALGCFLFFIYELIESLPSTCPPTILLWRNGRYDKAEIARCLAFKQAAAP